MNSIEWQLPDGEYALCLRTRGWGIGLRSWHEEISCQEVTLTYHEWTKGSRCCPGFPIDGAWGPGGNRRHSWELNGRSYGKCNPSHEALYLTQLGIPLEALKALQPLPASVSEEVAQEIARLQILKEGK